MKTITTLNVNGIRSVWRKNFISWLEQHQPDILCLQEVRADDKDIPQEFLSPFNYHTHYFSAQKKGYAGVALFSKEKPDFVQKGFQLPELKEFDDEGRFLEAHFGDLSVVSLYLPSGSSGEMRQESKMRFLNAFLPYLKERLKNEKKWLICGDFNIAHQEIDLKNWKSNQKNSGFLPQERQWFSAMLDLGLYDIYRHLYPNETDCYTWWSNRGKARENNVGWRIDYQIGNFAMAQSAKNAYINKEPRYSDHAPLSIIYQME